MKKLLLLTIPLFFIGCASSPREGYYKLTKQQEQRLTESLNSEIKNLKRPKVGQVFWADKQMNWFKNGDAYTIISVSDIKDDTLVSETVRNIRCSYDNPDEIKKYSFFHYEVLVRQNNVDKHIYLKSEFNLKCSELMGSDKSRSSIIEVKHGRYYNIITSSSYRDAIYSDFREINGELTTKDPLLKWRKNSKILRYVRNNDLFVGMPESAVYASWGNPDSTNRSVHSGKVHKELIYGRSSVYLKKGYVTSWDD